MKYFADILFFISWTGGFIGLAVYMGIKNCPFNKEEMYFVLLPFVAMGSIHFWQAGKRLRKEKGLK